MLQVLQLGILALTFISSMQHKSQKVATLESTRLLEPYSYPTRFSSNMHRTQFMNMALLFILACEEN